MYFIVNDKSGVITTINSVSSWATSGKFAFITDIQVAVRGGYLSTFNISMSEDYKNASLLFNYWENGSKLLHTNIFTAWKFPEGGLKGNLEYWVTFSKDIGNPGFLDTQGRITYGDNKYEIKLLQNIYLAEVNYNMIFEGNGRYGGTWTHW